VHAIEEDPSVNTNEAAQTGLTTIEILELCRDQLPTAAPPPHAPRRFGGEGYRNADRPPAPPSAPPAP
jgi:hypothetical protein